jgi:hypothetical protein
LQTGANTGYSISYNHNASQAHESAVMSRPAADFTFADERSVEQLDAAIGRLVLQMNADSYRVLVLVRDFDDRFGWKKWAYQSCAEWLSWRANISLSAAREKVRTAHALRSLPAIAAAFAEGRLSYSKVRALTRVAQLHDEDLLLAYALNANVARVEERCRQIRNVLPGSAHHAGRAWSGGGVERNRVACTASRCARRRREVVSRRRARKRRRRDGGSLSSRHSRRRDRIH